MSVNKSTKLVTNTAIVFILTLCYRLFGFLRESIIAAYLGNTAVSDAYYIAYSIPYAIINIIALGAISSAAVPVFTSYIEEGRQDKLFQTVNRLSTLMLLVSLVLCALTNLFLRPVIHTLAPGFDLATVELTISFSRIMLFIIPCLSLSGVFSSLMLSYRTFWAVPLSNIILNVCLVLGSLYAATQNNSTILSYSVLAASLIQVICTYLMTKRVKYSLRFSSFLRDEDVKLLMYAMIPICLSSLLGALNQLIGRAVASGLEVGSIASLNYADKLYQLPMGVLVGSMATVLLPYLSRSVAKGDRDSESGLYYQCLQVLFYALLPILFAFVFFSAPMVSLLFERGNFTAADTVRTAKTLQLYAFVLPGAAVIEVNNKIFFAHKSTRIPMLLSLVACVANAGLAVWLTKPFAQNGVVIALAVSMGLSAVCGLAVIKHNYPYYEKKVRLKTLLRSAVIAICLAAVMGTVSFAMTMLETPPGLFGRFVYLAAPLLLCVCIYTLLLHCFKIIRIDAVWRQLKSRVKSRPTT